MRVPPRILSSHVSFCDRTSNRATSRTGCLVRDKPAKASRYSEAEQRMRIRRLPSFQRVLSTSERRFKRPGAPSMRRAPCRRGHAGRRLLAENFACGPILGRVHAAAPESASAAWTSRYAPVAASAHSPIRMAHDARHTAHGARHTAHGARHTAHGTRRTAHGARPTTHGAAACLRSAGEPRPIAFPHPRHATRPDRRAVPSRGACRARRWRHPASDSPRAFFFSARQYGHIHSEQSLT
ncbi:Uncharacterised protein [Burkholderia pseudomallei]|nr:Uncharacterised protein [Burkholderia pseudomallei]